VNVIKETSRTVVTLERYDGVCDGCGTPLSYVGQLILIEILNNDDVMVLVPIDRLVCPFCNKDIVTIKLWKNLEVSKELKVSK
jgi:hypothetical protein